MYIYANTFYIDMSSDHPEVRTFLGVLISKISHMRINLDGMHLINCVIGCQQFSSKYLEVRRIIEFLTIKLQNSRKSMDEEQMVLLLNMMNNMSSNVLEVRQFIITISEKLRMCGGIFTAIHVSGIYMNVYM